MQEAKEKFEKLIHKAFYIGSLERGKPHVQAGRNGLTGEIMESVGGEVIETETIVCIVDAISLKARILGRRDAKCLQRCRDRQCLQCKNHSFPWGLLA